MTHNTRARRAHLPGSVQLAALVLAALALFFAARPARAADWMTPYLEKVQEWGVIQPDASGSLHEDRNLTRAEFVTMMNRAFGYVETGPIPFADVPPNAWYAEDIAIAYHAGYFGGTSATTASPMNLVTREQAAVLLGRCLRFQGVPNAASSAFTDMREIGGWSRPLVQEAVDLGIIGGYSDGTFRPKQPITRGQMACFLVRALGTLVQEPGEQTSGGVYGNLTITTPGVKLKDTVVTGNLYLTGGVGLGSVELENVSVLGKIVICGGGEAEGGKQSVLLRNVTAGALELDSLTEQFLSLQAEGLTDIKEVTIRTSGYVEDRTEDGLGLQTIRLDGVDGALLQLAGNIKRVIDLTPSSTLQVAQGVADMVTIDERAVDAALTVDDEAVIRELNLDRGTAVTGKGNVSHLNINAPGSNVSMLPDTIYVRPGITGNVSNQNMDTNAAAASSADPRLLSGYPKAKNIAPTSADAVFRTNKTGTIHWAVTALMDGSLGEEELMNPGSYAKILRSGTISATAPNQDFTARLAGLTREGSYYISALLEDARGRRSPVKVAAFTTPDDTAPNFATGYPQNPILTVDADNEQVAQVMVMATKSCQMYYVLLPQGSTAPTAADFRSAALPGNLGYGIVTLRKNTPFLLSRINTSHLQEQTTYDLYLWLNDADNGKSSAVRRVQFTTKDMTPPTLQDLKFVSCTGNSVTLSFMLDEPGTLSWAVTKRGENFGVSKTDPTELDQIKIEGVLVSGKVINKGGPVRAARAATYYNFTVTGLEPQTEYDLFYAFKDTAGNYGVYNAAVDFPFPIKTLDTTPPSAALNFDPANEDANQKLYPWPESSVLIEFSETVLGGRNSSQGLEPDDFYALYQRVENSSGDEKELAKRDLANVLQDYITFYQGSAPTPNPNTKPSDRFKVTVLDGTQKPEEVEELPDWIDYREAKVTQAGGKTTITFPGGTGIRMQSGQSYYFRLERTIEDTSGYNLPTSHLSFSTVYATVNVDQSSGDGNNVTYQDADGQTVSRRAYYFTLDPQNTEAVPKDTRWDMLLWTDTSFRYDLLVRLADTAEWTLLGRMAPSVSSLNPGTQVYNSLNGNFNSNTYSYSLIDSGLFGSVKKGQGRPFLNEFVEKLEFAIVPVESTLEKKLTVYVQLLAGDDDMDFNNVSWGQGSAGNITDDVTPIGEPDMKAIPISPPDRAPVVSVDDEKLIPKANDATVSVTMDRFGTLYYAAVPLSGTLTGTGYVAPRGLEPLVNKMKPGLETIPDSFDDNAPLWLDSENPAPDYIVNLVGNSPSGEPLENGVVCGRNTTLLNSYYATLTIPGLEPNTTYLLYLVAQDKEEPYTLARQTLCYKFTTTPPDPLRIRISSGSNAATIGLTTDSMLRYVVVNQRMLTGRFLQQPFNLYADTSKNVPDAYMASSYTVLQAMTNPFSTDTNNYVRSVFDEYATEGAKKTFFGYLDRPDEGNGFEAGSVVHQHPQSYTADPTILVRDENTSFNDRLNPPLTPFMLIVTAQSPDGDYAFRATGPYTRVTTSALTAHVTLDEPTAENPNYVLSVSFNTAPRYTFGYGEDDIHSIDSCLISTEHTGSNSLSPNGFVSIGFVTDGRRNVDLVSPAPGNHEVAVGRTLEFEISPYVNSAYLPFGEGLCNDKGDFVMSQDGQTISALVINVKKGESGMLELQDLPYGW